MHSSCKKPVDKTEEFEKTYGGNLEDNAEKILLINGSIYLFGSTQSFNETNGNFYLIKLDTDGKVLWEKNYGNNDKEVGTDFIATKDGNIILIGTTEVNGSGLSNIRVLKLNLEGILIWEKTYTKAGKENPRDIIELSNSMFCIVGTSTSFSSGTNDIHILWIDQNGNLINEKNYGGFANEAGAEVLEIENQELMIFAHFQTAGAETRDFYLLKTDLLGDSIWSKTYGGNDYEESQDFEQTADGGFLLCGHSASTDPMHNMFAMKLNANGEVEWENNYGGAMHDGGQALIINQEGNYVMVARSMSFGSGDRDAYLVITDANGNVLSDKIIGGERDDRIDDIAENDAFYFLTGHSNSFSENEDNDVYLVKIKK